MPPRKEPANLPAQSALRKKGRKTNEELGLPPAKSLNPGRLERRARRARMRAEIRAHPGLHDNEDMKNIENRLNEEERMQQLRERMAHAREVRAARHASDEDWVGMTTLQKNFVLEYQYDFNPRRAYIRAGGAPANCGSGSRNMMTLPKVWAHIKKIDAARAEKLRATGGKITEELSKMAFFNIEEICEIDEYGRLVIDFNRADVDQLACVQEISYDKDGQQRIKFTDKRAALELLGKIRNIKLFAEVQEHVGEDGKPLPPPTVNVNFGVKPLPQRNSLSNASMTVAALAPGHATKPSGTENAT